MAVRDEYDRKNIKDIKSDVGVVEIRKPLVSVNKNTDLEKTDRTQVEEAMDRAEIARLYLMGYSSTEIAISISNNRPYQLSTQKIGSEIKELLVIWLENQLINLDIARARELAKIDKLETAYWQAWQGSTKAKVKTEVTGTKAKGNGKDTTKIEYAPEKVVRKEEERDGNYMFLTGVQWCINKRCEILGMNAPAEINIRDWRAEAKKHGIQVDEVFDSIVGKFVEQAEISSKDNKENAKDNNDTRVEVRSGDSAVQEAVPEQSDIEAD